MEFKIDCVKYKNVIFIISLIVVAAGIIYGLVTGYEFDIDFKGGTRIQVDLGEEYENSDIVAIVEEIAQQTPDIQTTSSGEYSVSITTQVISSDLSDAIVEALQEKYQNMGEATTKNVQASYGKDLLNSAIIAVIVAIIVLLVYISIRFKTLGYVSAFCAVIALVFDVCFVFAVYGVFKFPINSTFVAVILTIIGYSINDTIIIYDRIRENKRLVTKSNDEKDVINQSISQTMKRTMVTSITTLLAVGVLLIFALVNGQQTLKEFAIPLVIGVIEGTFSSIFIATNLLYTVNGLIAKLKKA